MTTFAIPQPKEAGPSTPPVATEHDDGPALAPLAILSMHTHCEPESSRYALSAIKIEHAAGRAFAVATDGRRMAILGWKPDEKSPGEFFLPMGAAKSAEAQIVAKRKWKKQAELTKTSVTVATEGGQEYRASDNPIEGRFPRWRDVVPASLDGYTHLLIDAKFLREASELLAEIGDGDDGVTLSIKDADSPVLLSKSRSEGASGLVLIMPKRADEGQPTRPAWMP